MGTSVLLVFLVPIMAFEFIFSGVFSLFGMDFDAVMSWLGGTESTDLFLGLFARVYEIFEPVLKPIIDIFIGFI